MRKVCNFSVLVTITLALIFGTWSFALAQDEAPIKIILTPEKTSFDPADPIKVQVRVYNTELDEVITREGFFGQNFYTLITFADPDGLPVRNIFKDETDDPGPPDSFDGRPAAVVERIPPLPEGDRTIVLDDAREFYRLEKYGWYTAQVLVPMETFSAYLTDERGVLYSYLDEPGREAYNPVASNKVRFEIASPAAVETGSVVVKVSHLKIGQETRPKTTKTPLEGVPVRLIPQDAIPEDYHPINWKTYNQIWTWTTGPGAAATVTSYTSSKGLAGFDRVEQGDYLVLANYNGSQDFKHMGSLVLADDPDWLTDQPIENNLMVMEKLNGKKMPGKTTRRKGSFFLITEPEFVVWDSDQETYPFVFESVGEWDVETAVVPPEGFVPDHKALDAKVANEVETVQFTITDVGSRWEETEVRFKIKHKKKTEKLKSKVGVKLSKKLAKKKGLSVYGHTEPPGPFKGGKKVRDKDEEKSKDKKNKK